MATSDEVINESISAHAKQWETLFFARFDVDCSVCMSFRHLKIRHNGIKLCKSLIQLYKHTSHAHIYEQIILRIQSFDCVRKIMTEITLNFCTQISSLLSDTRIYGTKCIPRFHFFCFFFLLVAPKVVSLCVCVCEVESTNKNIDDNNKTNNGWEKKQPNYK